MSNLIRLSHIEGTKTAEMKRTLKFVKQFKAKKKKDGYKEVIVGRGDKGEVYLKWVKE